MSFLHKETQGVFVIIVFLAISNISGCGGSSDSTNGNQIEKEWYRDLDEDGYGNPNLYTLAATQPDGYVEDNTDPDDSNPEIYPGVPELSDEGENTDEEDEGTIPDESDASNDEEDDDDISDDSGTADDEGGQSNDPDPDNAEQQISPILKDALDESLTYFHLESEKGDSWPAQQRASAMLYLTTATLEGASIAEYRLFEHIRNLLIPGNEPDTTGSLSTRGHAAVIASFALIKSEPELWNQLSSEEKNKISLIVKASLVSCAVTSSDHGDFSTGLDGEGNFKKNWNPNYREAFICELIASTLFFGPLESTNILEHFNCDDYIEEANTAGLPNISSLFSYQGPPDINLEEIEAVIKDYSYKNYTLTELPELYEEVTSFTFSGVVACGISNDEPNGFIMSGCNDLPNKGELGMLYEFDARDGDGLRSSLSYSALGWTNNVISRYLLANLGYITSPEIDDIVQIGSKDLFYKAESGYNSYALGKAKEEGEENLTFGFKYIKSIWMDYLR